MSQDALSEVLRAVRLRGAIFFHVQGMAPWAAETPPSREIVDKVLPGAEHMLEFHAVIGGSCWAAIVGQPPVRLDEGDLILFPQGDAHVVSSAPGVRPSVSGKEVFATPRPSQLPYALSVSNVKFVRGRDGDGSDPSRATLVCGFLGLDALPFNPLLSALPRVLHMPAASLGADSWITGFMRAVADESSRRRPGGEAVLERMSEMLFVEVLRRHVDSLSPEHTGWLAGMRDPAVSRVLGLLHGSPGADWSLERLADEAAMSRSALHERFVHFIGQPPMQYLTRWRMQIASGMLRETNGKLIEIALACGYESEAAFSRAFKREVGAAPGAWRARRRLEAGQEKSAS